MRGFAYKPQPKKIREQILRELPAFLRRVCHKKMAKPVFVAGVVRLRSFTEAKKLNRKMRLVWYSHTSSVLLS